MNDYNHLMMDKPLNRGEILSLILLTYDSNCYYDLCLSQRNESFNKWIWFDYCLYWQYINYA